jgi:hypothetical protein
MDTAEATMDRGRHTDGSNETGGITIMAIVAEEVRVAGAGHVYAAPEGSVIPGTLSALAAPFVDLGYVTTDGVTFTFSRETEDLDAWQADKIRVLSSREPATVGFALMQTNSDVMVLAMGGGEITDEGGGLFKYSPVQGDNAVRTLVIEFTDGGKTYRYGIPRAQIEGDVAYTLTRTGALTYPLTFGLLDAQPKYFILSDDPAMGDGSLPGTVGGGEGVATATISAAAPSGTSFGDDSLWVDTTDLNQVSIFNGTAWAEVAGVQLAAAPASASIGTVAPTSGAGVPGTENDVYFQNTGSLYAVWIKGAGGATVWTDSGDTIPLT